MQKQPLLVVGSLAFDDLEMPHGNYPDVVGGAATYCAYSASVFAPVRLVGVVGSDFDQATLKDLESRGVDTAGVEHDLSGKTFRWKGRYSADLNSRETLDTQLNVFANFSPKLPQNYKSTPFVLLGNIHPSLQLDVLKSLEKPTLVAADTMNLWIDITPNELRQVLAGIDLLIVNDEEARQLSGVVSITGAARALRAMGPSKVIIKRGEHGAYLFDGDGEDGVFYVPAYPLEKVMDPTGAGDSFAGGLMGYLAATGDTSTVGMRRAMFFASTMGSLCVEAVGTAMLRTATSALVKTRTEAFRKMVDFGGQLPFPG